jgi:ABC-type amino acid transport substrate-binding protein
VNRPLRHLAITLLAFAAAGGAFAQASPLPDTLAKIRAAKAIQVAFSGDSLPFSFVAENGQPAGFAIDICRRVIARIGRTVDMPDLKVNWLVGTATERVAMVASGKADLDCANTTASRSRMRDVDFSSLVFVDAGGLLAKSGGEVRRFVDLNGKSVGVIAGTTTEARLDAMLKQNLVNAKVVRLKEGNEGLAMLESGSLQALAGDKIKLIGLAVQAKDPNALIMLPDDLSYEPLAFALPRNDSAFRLEVNTALTQVYAGGEIERIFDQWLGKLGRPSGLLAALYLLNAIPD